MNEPKSEPSPRVVTNYVRVVSRPIQEEEYYLIPYHTSAEEYYLYESLFDNRDDCCNKIIPFLNQCGN